MNMRDIIDIVLKESQDLGVTEDTYKTAMNDFRADWLEINDENHEPEPRRGIIRKMRTLGFDPDRDYSDPRFEQALQDLLKAEGERFIAALPWDGTSLSVERAIAAPDGWERNPDISSFSFGGLGVYWAISDKFSFFGTGAKEHLYILFSRIEMNQVDWPITVLKHLTYSEDEIRIKDNQRIPLLRVQKRVEGVMQDLDISHLHGRLFTGGVRGDWGD